MIIQIIMKMGSSKLSLWVLMFGVAILEVFVLPPRPTEKLSLIREVYSFVLGFSVCLVGIAGAVHNFLLRSPSATAEGRIKGDD
jgi:hypothetical protein